MQTSEKLHYFIEQCTRTPSQVKIRGWAGIEDEAVEKASFKITGPHPSKDVQFYSLNYGQERRDVAESLNPANLQYCGFETQIPTPHFKPLSGQIILRTTSGEEQTIKVKIEKERWPYLKLIKATYRAATPQNIKQAIKWLLTGNTNILIKKIFSLIDVSIEEKSKIIPISNINTRNNNNYKKEILDECIDIVIPIYNGFQYLDNLFDSIRNNTNGKYKIIVINDASTDHNVKPLLKEKLKNFRSVEFIENRKNLGFVRSVNLAAEHVSGDFVILNTDTVVPPAWLERLMNPIKTDRTIASTTPFSNAATICSFPEICVDNPMFFDLNAEQIDRGFADIGDGFSEIEVPSGVGFCMGINLDVWKKVGAFDQETFGLGYGEENDWCQRAKAAGFRNVLVPNLFVQHDHGGSFPSEVRQKLIRKNLNIIQKRYPKYQQEVDNFIATDEPNELRALAALNIIEKTETLSPILIIDHDLGGGANSYRNELLKKRIDEKQPVFLLIPHPDSRLENPKYIMRLELGELNFQFEVADLNDLRYFFTKKIKLEKLLINNLVSYKNIKDIIQFSSEMKIISQLNIVVLLHDFYPLCPSYTLLNNKNLFCNLPKIETCDECLLNNHNATNPNRQDIEQWRDNWRILLDISDKILCFSEDSKSYLIRIYPDSEKLIEVQPHELTVEFDKRPKIKKNNTPKIGVVGGISVQKGSEVIKQLAQHIQNERIDAEIIVIGELNDAPKIPSIRITGRYDPIKLPDLIEFNDVNVCFMPSIWPETFSYVTSELMALEMPILAFDIGAPAERLSTYHSSKLIPLANSDQPDIIITELIKLAGIKQQPDHDNHSGFQARNDE